MALHVSKMQLCSRSIKKLTQTKFFLSSFRTVSKQSSSDSRDICVAGSVDDVDCVAFRKRGVSEPGTAHAHKDDWFKTGSSLCSSDDLSGGALEIDGVLGESRMGEEDQFEEEGAEGESCYMGLTLPSDLGSLLRQEISKASLSWQQREVQRCSPISEEFLEASDHAVEEGCVEGEGEEEWDKGNELELFATFQSSCAGTSAQQCQQQLQATHCVQHCFCCSLKSCNNDSLLQAMQDSPSVVGTTDDAIIESPPLRRFKREAPADSSPSSSTNSQALELPASKESSKVQFHSIKKEIFSSLNSIIIKKPDKGIRLRLRDACQDCCLYSDVCHTLARTAFSLHSRKALHDLFPNLDTKKIFNDSLAILQVDKNEEIDPSPS